MSEQAEKLQQFIAITGSNEDRANFFLESSAWNVEVAMSRYYENDGEDVEFVESTASSAPAEQDSQRPRDNQRAKEVPQPKPKKTSKIATINTITTSSDEEEEGQAYYAGGSEQSGQQVLGPPKKRDIVADMFKSVQEHGVEILEPGSASSSSRAFRGTGYKLGQDNNDTEVIPGAEEHQPPQQITLMLWENGFSLDDGELRSYTDPANRNFLESIRRGEMPHELKEGATEVTLEMQDRRMEVYKPPASRKVVKPFQGHGYTLGSPAPVVIGAAKEEDKSANEERARQSLKIDTSKPTTSLQIRLADGTRLVGQFNQDHTIGQVRTYITISRPQFASQDFNLLSSYPSKVLDDTQTLKDAGLLNAAIMQKLI